MYIVYKNVVLGGHFGLFHGWMHLRTVARSKAVIASLEWLSLSAGLFALHALISVARIADLELGGDESGSFARNAVGSVHHRCRVRGESRLL